MEQALLLRLLLRLLRPLHRRLRLRHDRQIRLPVNLSRPRESQPRNLGSVVFRREFHLRLRPRLPPRVLLQSVRSRRRERESRRSSRRCRRAIFHHVRPRSEVHPAPRKAPGVRLGRTLPQEHQATRPEAPALGPWCGVHRCPRAWERSERAKVLPSLLSASPVRQYPKVFPGSSHRCPEVRCLVCRVPPRRGFLSLCPVPFSRVREHKRGVGKEDPRLLQSLQPVRRLPRRPHRRPVRFPPNFPTANAAESADGASPFF